MNATDAPLQCFNCGSTLTDLPLPMSRQANCPACFEELHCCRMCRHYRPQRATGCDEERAEVPTRKDTANFCEWFVARPGAHEPRQVTAADATRAKLDALFGGDDAPGAAATPAPDDPRARLEALFGSKSDEPGDAK